MRRWLGLGVVMVLSACSHASLSVPASALSDGMSALKRHRGFLKETYQGRSYKLYVPSSYDAAQPTPLVVMLHGCTQDPDQFAKGTQINALADRERFLVLYPEQPSSAHQMKCWNWFDVKHQVRGSGEPNLINGMVAHVKERYTVDAKSVFVAGLSAGGAMAVIMGATYPDTFAAIGVAAGLEYQAAKNEQEARKAMSSGGPDPDRQGQAAFAAMGKAERVVPVILFQGTADQIVNAANAKQIMAQWAQTNDLATDGTDNGDIDARPEREVPGQSPTGAKFIRSLYEDGQQHVVMESYLVEGMGHAWSGGSKQGSYTDPKGPNATDLMWEFFKSHRQAARRK